MKFLTKQSNIPPFSAFFALFLHKIENLLVAVFSHQGEICFLSLYQHCI